MMEEMILILISLIMAACILVYKDKKYKSTAYYQITKNPYSSIKYDKGKYGEYLIYKRLKHFEKNGGRFLFNVYIPKANNETTEIDVILICSKGLFVFESKNYSGWIFGNELHRNWTQIFPRGRGRSYKARFYNPIMQNASHIKHLKRFIGENVTMQSIIVFSDGCTFKDVTVQNSDIVISKSNKLASVLAKICRQPLSDRLSSIEINNIYNKLHPCSQPSNQVKAEHFWALKKATNFASD